MNIGTQIRALRRQKGTTQEALAAELGVTVGAVSKWENNMTLPDVQMLCCLADYFKVTTDKLLGRAHKGTFAVCDDAPLICTVIKDIMEKEGYSCVGLTEDGTHLRTLFEENIPDILFLDVHLAEENGLDLLKEIKEKYASAKVIMVSADNTEETLRTAVSYGSDAYVIKPFLPQHIMIAVDRL
ncbi:MAG: response regulator [Lachnospiraceae bacterium]|nr:response regulator [Lachnospiraceae bacterium]